MQIKKEKLATCCEDAFIVKSDRIGGRIYGNAECERIALSESTFFNENYAEKEFLSVGNLWIYTGISSENVENYERELNVETGVANSKWEVLLQVEEEDECEEEDKECEDSCSEEEYSECEDQDTKCIEKHCEVHTRAFVSHVHKMFCYEIKAEKEILQLEVRFQTEGAKLDSEYVRYNTDSIYFECKARKQKGMLLVGKANLYCDGRPAVTETGVKFQNASKLCIYLMMETGFEENSGSEAMENEEVYLPLSMRLQCALNRRLVSFEEVSIDKIQRTNC